MVDNFNEILFKPVQLRKYKDTKGIKVFLYFLFLGILSSLVLFIDLATFSGFGIGDKYSVEQSTGVNFGQAASNLPDCVLQDGVLDCQDENVVYEIGSFQNRFIWVLDPSNQLSTNPELKPKDSTIAFTNEGVRYHTRFASILISYDRLPSKWQTVNFTEIRTSTYPADALYTYFIGGLNQVYRMIKPLLLLFIYGLGVVMVVFETLLTSFIFFLFYRRLNYKFSEIFKIAAFAQTLSLIVALIFQLLRLNVAGSFIFTLITFIYMYRALMGPRPIKPVE